jgi:hypothetical protein
MGSHAAPKRSHGSVSRRGHAARSVAVTVLAGSLLTGVAASASAANGSLPAHTVPAVKAAGGHAARSHRAFVVRLRHIVVKDLGDAYTSSARPRAHLGRKVKIVVTSRASHRKVSYLKFDVPRLPHRGRIVGARLRLSRDVHHFPATRVVAYRLKSTHWSQSTLDVRNAPRLGRRLSAVRTSRSMHSIALSVSSAVVRPGRYGFALTAAVRHNVVRFKARETRRGPTLVVTYRYRVPTGSRASARAKTHHRAGSSATIDDPPASGSTCSMSAAMVPSCGVLFGGWLTSFGGSNAFDALSDFNSAAGTHMILVHDYRTPGQVLSPHDIAAARTRGDVLQLNWKPAWTWSDADGGNAGVNAQIDAMAGSIKSLGSTRIIVSLFHEPENDVSGGAAGCPSTIYKGAAGTPAEYRAMWANVEARFAAFGVDNVAWAMNYMGYPTWNCMVDDLWPGNGLVDWVLWDPYAAGTNDTFVKDTSTFYDFLTQNSDASHNYLSKAWGLGEWQTDQQSRAAQESYYLGIKSALDNETFPKLKLLSTFDSPGYGDLRVAYDYRSVYDPTELANFVALANDPKVLLGNASALHQ